MKRWCFQLDFTFSLKYFNALICYYTYTYICKAHGSAKIRKIISFISSFMTPVFITCISPSSLASVYPFLFFFLQVLYSHVCFFAIFW